MKKAFLLVLVMMSMSLWAQDRTNIVVKSSEKASGVVVVTAQTGAAEAPKRFELRCNLDMGDCKSLPAGDYIMVKLPKNWGSYDCVNVDVYPAGGDPTPDKRIGEYCLLTK